VALLYFFLSYARGDEDGLVHRFYEDLSAEVRLRAGEPRDAVVGFIDRTIQVGERWPKRLEEALATCGSFLALITPRYFQSVPCGKEWYLFGERTRRYDAGAPTESPLLKPVMWIPTPPTKMHPVADPIQYYSAALGETYQRLGVRQLMRLQRHQDDYHSFVFELAGQIVDGVEMHPIPAGGWAAGFDQAVSAFHSSTVRLDHSVSAQWLSRPLLVHLIVAASSKQDMTGIRDNLAAYGDRPLDWAPFRPPMPVPLAEYAIGIAENHSFETGVAELSELASRADLASRHNQIVVLLIDAWVTHLEHAKRALREHNDRSGLQPPPTTAVLIPNSRDDIETRQNWADLSRSCRDTLARLAHDDELYRPAIATHRHFELELPGVLETAKNRLYSSGPVRRSPVGPLDTQPPRIDGPSYEEGNGHDGD
jgi:FxsC-like protein